MWRLQYRDSIHPAGVWAVEWFRTEAEAEKYAFDNDTDPYEVRFVQWPPRRIYERPVGSWDSERQLGDELTNAIAFMNRWAQHILQ